MLSDEVITGLVFIIILVVILSWFAFRYYFMLLVLIVVILINACIFKYLKYQIFFFYIYRHYQYEQKLARLLWKVDFKDLLRLPDSMEYNSPYNYQERVSDF